MVSGGVEEELGCGGSQPFNPPGPVLGPNVPAPSRAS